MRDHYDEEADARRSPGSADCGGHSQNIGDGVVACDADGGSALFNRASEQFLGGLVQPIAVADRARHYGLFKPDGTTLLTTDELPLHRRLEGRIVQDAELVMISGTGEPRWIALQRTTSLERQEEAGRSGGDARRRRAQAH